MIDLSSSDTVYGYGYDIDDAGTVVGYSTTTVPGAWVGKVWTVDSNNVVTTKDLGGLGGGSTMAYGINNSGQIVGSSASSTAANLQTYGTYRAFVCFSAIGMVDLNSLVDPNVWTLISAQIINNSGVVTGWGLYTANDVTVTRAFTMRRRWAATTTSTAWSTART